MTAGEWMEDKTGTGPAANLPGHCTKYNDTLDQQRKISSCILVIVVIKCGHNYSSSLIQQQQRNTIFGWVGALLDSFSRR